MTFTLIPNFGLQELPFGSSSEQLYAWLGKADYVEDLENAELNMKHQVHFYEDSKMYFFFNTANQLEMIECENRNATIFGANLFKLDNKELQKILEENGLKLTETEQESSNEWLFYYDEGNIDFYYKGKQLYTVSMSHEAN